MSWTGQGDSCSGPNSRNVSFQIGSTVGKPVLEPRAFGKMNPRFGVEVAKAEAVILVLKGWCASESPGEL